MRREIILTFKKTMNPNYRYTSPQKAYRYISPQRHYYEDESSYKTNDNIFKRGLKKIGVIEAPKRPEVLAPLDLPAKLEYLRPEVSEFDKKGVWHPGYTLFVGKGGNKSVPRPIFERIDNFIEMRQAIQNGQITTNPLNPNCIKFEDINNGYCRKALPITGIEIGSTPILNLEGYPVIWEVSAIHY